MSQSTVEEDRMSIEIRGKRERKGKERDDVRRTKAGWVMLKSAVLFVDLLGAIVSCSRNN